MSKILFVAFSLPEKLSDEFVNYRESYADEKLFKWTTKNDLHMTLMFLGAVEDDIVPEIVDALNDIASIQQPFSLQLRGIEYAPENKTPSMIWTRFIDNADFEILAHNAIEEITFVLGEIKTLKPLPHITLARFNKNIEKPRALPILQSHKFEKGNMEVAQMHLMESKMTQTGTTYNTLATFDFLASTIASKIIEPTQ